MHFSYNKLFKLMIDRNIKKKELSEMSDVSATSIAKLGKGGNVNTGGGCVIFCGRLVQG